MCVGLKDQEMADFHLADREWFFHGAIYSEKNAVFQMLEFLQVSITL